VRSIWPHFSHAENKKAPARGSSAGEKARSFFNACDIHFAMISVASARKSSAKFSDAGCGCSFPHVSSLTQKVLHFL